MLNSYHPRVATDSSYHPSHDFHPMDPNHHYYHAHDTYDAQDDRIERSLLLGGGKKKKKKGNRHHQQLETRSGSLILMAAHIITLTFASFLIYITRPYLESDIFNTLYLSWTALALSGVIILISLVALYQVYKFLWYAYPGNGLVLNHFLAMFLIIILSIYTGGILRYWQDDMTILEQEMKGLNYKTWHALMGCGLIISHLIIMMGTLRVKFHDAIRVSIYKWTSFLASLIILSLCVVILFLTILVACSYGKNTDPHVSPLLHQVTVSPLSIFVYGIISGAFLLFSISIVGVAAPFYRPHAHVRILIWSLPILSFPLLGFAIPAYLYCHIDSGARPTCDNYFLLMSILMSIATQPFVLMGASAYYAWKRFAYRHKQIHTDFI